MTTRDTEARPDVIVVGAGSAGAAVATRLSEDPTCRVLLLEAGPDCGSEPEHLPRSLRDATDSTATPYDWGYESRPTGLRRPVPVYAGKVVGGSSATNNVMALRGHPDGYDAWARAGCRGRPVATQRGAGGTAIYRAHLPRRRTRPSEPDGTRGLRR